MSSYFVLPKSREHPADISDTYIGSHVSIDDCTADEWLGHIKEACN